MLLLTLRALRQVENGKLSVWNTHRPIGSLVVPFWDYLIGSINMNHKKELLRSLWVIGPHQVPVAPPAGR